MLIIGLVGLIAAFAIPAAANIRQVAMEKVCSDRLRTLHTAKIQWAIDTGAGDDIEPTIGDLTTYIVGSILYPVDPEADYIIGTLEESPICTKHSFVPEIPDANPIIPFED